MCLIKGAFVGEKNFDAFLFIYKLCISVSPSISRKFHTDVCWVQNNMVKRKLTV